MLLGMSTRRMGSSLSVERFRTTITVAKCGCLGGQRKQKEIKNELTYESNRCVVEDVVVNSLARWAERYFERDSNFK